MKTKILSILILLSMLLCHQPSYSDDKDHILDHAILVNVNGRKVTRSQLDTMGLILFRSYFPNRDESSINEAELDNLSAKALKELIIICLTEDEFDILKNDEDPLNDIDIPTSKVEKEIKKLKLGKLRNEPLAERYARSKIIRRNIVYASHSSLEPSPREVKLFYLKNKSTVFTGQRMIRIRELFLSSDESNATLSKKQANMLFNTLNKSSISKRLTLFPEMAKEFSRDKFRKDGGLIVTGSPGNFLPQDHTFERGDGTTFFPKEMIEAIHSLNAKGDIILTKSARGWHIIMLDELKGGRKIPLNKCKTIIEGYLSDEKYEDAYSDWLKSKVARNKITWNDGDPFPPEKITSVSNKEESLRYLRAELQNYFDKKKSSTKRR